MATQTIEFEFLTAVTPSVKLFAVGSDTVLDTPTATEYTNRKGLYSFTQTDRSAGEYTITVVGSGINAIYHVTLALATATFRAYEAGVESLLERLSETRAGYLDASIASRSTYTGADTSGVTTLVGLLTPTRAGYLDNIGTPLQASSYSAPLDAAGVRSAIGLSSANADTQLSAIKTDTGNLVTRITSTLFSGITSLAHWLGAIAGKTADNSTQTEIRATTSGAGYTITTDSLEAIRDRGDAAWAGGGGSGLTGANVITVTVTDGTDPVPGAYVKFRAGGDVEVKRTNGSGVVTFTVDDNTWTISIDATNLTFEPVTLTVTGDDSVTYEMDAVATSGTAWATGDDLVAYFDARTIGQIISDTGTTVAIGSVPSHAVVTRMLLVASGAVNSALMASKRYSEADLSGLDDPSAELLRSITCDIAMYNLLRRRLDLYPDRQEQMRKLSESHLERLRKGEIVLDVQSVKDAGVVSHATFTQSDVNLGVPSIRDQAGYYPARNFSR